MQEELLRHLEYLTKIRPFRNFGNIESLKVASDYIEKEFKNCAYTIQHQKWNYGKYEYTNVIAAYKPEHKKRLIVGAHYDVYSNQPGADDNTSGVAGLLHLAKSIAEKQPDLPYGIDFVAYCLEEPPHFGTKNMGSFVHAESLFKTRRKLWV
jgi:Zn-dependent M28 family amino/carboxypeptidase